MKEPPTEAALLLHLFKNAVAVRNVFILHVAKGRKQVQCNGDVAPSRPRPAMSCSCLSSNGYR